MNNRRNRHLISVITVLAMCFALLTGCSNADPLRAGYRINSDTIVIGSQDYYSNEIIAEIWAQALEQKGYKVDRQFRIGQREVYLPEIEAGNIDLLPEYTGPLLQYWQRNTAARRSDDVYAQLQRATPGKLRVLEQSPATDQDSYVVTREFAAKWALATLKDLQRVTAPLTIGANSEAQKRNNGPRGLQRVYGVQTGFTPIEDSGGPLTVRALKTDMIQLAIIYTADPAIKANNLVALEDTEGLFLASHLVPLASNNVSTEAATIINSISAKLTTETLIALNERSVTEQLTAAIIAKEWLAQAQL
ncbi:ABC transporter substrate-binding protein [Canibacter sp. lx-72]|uniref:ABC transporter substrate-binding protein n=1 Tax=Canibacter zhuwentaonis TaxID=2837491 RepID=UPI001BDD2690|nr:ABC transporter substrate-binding protein [Canibacter zhuwentaonis]MBT1017969.1 ABC transporter substrate-binding protein [Canibacter zhuwentaonis]